MTEGVKPPPLPLPPRDRRGCGCTGGAAVVAVLFMFGGCFFTNAVLEWRATPDRSQNLWTFLRMRPLLDEIQAVQVDGRRYVIVYGPAGRFLPSGPSAYVFDDVGLFVDWSPDTGDDGTFDERWGAQAARGGKPLTRMEVLGNPATGPSGTGE